MIQVYTRIDSSKFIDTAYRYITGVVHDTERETLKQIAGELGGVTRILTEKTKESLLKKPRGNNTGSLHNSIAYMLEKTDMVQDEDGDWSSVVNIKLSMNDYGYAIGSRTGTYRFGVSKANLIIWMKQKMGKGAKFYVRKSENGRSVKKSVRDENDINTAAKTILRYIKLKGSKTSGGKAGYTGSRPLWYMPTKEVLETVRNRIKSNMNLVWGKKINQRNKI